MDYHSLAKDFRDRGLLVIENFFDPVKLNEIEVELQNSINRLSSMESNGQVIYESGPERKIRNIFRLEQGSEYFASLARALQLIDLVRAIFEDEPVLIGVELFGKPAQVGSEVPYHQDNAYFNLIPDDALTVWVALADSTMENGCVRYIEGSNTLGNLPHRASNVKGNSMGLCELPSGAGPEVCGIVLRGGAILHHCNTIHRSEPNRSNRDRPGLLFVYKAARCRIDESRHSKYRKVAEAMWKA